MKEKNVRLNEVMITGAIVLVKMIMGGLFSSDYQDKMFIPFVDSFLSGNNPYEYYYGNRLPSSFPYFPLMLLIETTGGGLLKLFSPESIFIKNILFKLPLLVFDLTGFCFIRKLNVGVKYATVFYFCSPIILYATYIHGQLDIIPTALLIAAVYYLLSWKKERNLLLYALFLGLAVSTKFHIAAALPVLFLYIAKKKNYLEAVKYHMVSFLVVALIVLPFWGDGFINTVLFNKEQASVLTVGLDYGSTQVIIPVAVLIMVYLNVFELNYFNRNLLISMLTLLFTVFLVFLAPMPAWFVWIVPFLAVYYGYVDEDRYTGMMVYALFNCAYIIYFVFFHQTEYTDICLLGDSWQFLKINAPAYKYAVFTALAACLAVTIYKVYRFGIASNSLYKRRNIPFSIGIAGDSGSGKSKMIEKIEHLFGGGRDVLFIEGDGDHRWTRNNENWEKYTALNPKANYLYRQAADIHRLKAGNHISRVDYDHNLGLFSEIRKVSPKKYIVLCGLHSLYLPQLRRELDLKVYMNTDDELRKYWKIQRDTEKRGYSRQAIVKQIEKRLPDAEKYIYPQKQFADVVITYFDRTLENCYVDNHDVVLSVSVDLSIDVDVADFIEEFGRCGINVVHTIQEDLIHQTLTFVGEELNANVVDYSSLAEKCIPQYEEFFSYQTMWGQDVEGVIQFLLLYMISVKMRGDNY